MKNLFTFYLDENLRENISLKNLLKTKLNGAFVLSDLKIELILGEKSHINLIDDLLDFDIQKSFVEIVLNFESSINYNLKMLNDLNFNIDQRINSLVIFDKETGLIEKELYFKFVGKNSSAKVNCSYRGVQDNVFNLKTVQDHQESNTTSDLQVKGAFFNKSKFFCDNLIKVGKNLTNITANQVSKNILIGCNSRVVCSPKLEVQSNKVNCKHGAFVTKIDEEQLFYLQSRGLDSCSAKELIINSFLN